MNNIFQKLSTHELPIDNSFWEDMENRLQQQKRRKFMPLWWIASGIAASFALLLLLKMPENVVKQEQFAENLKQEQSEQIIFKNIQTPILTTDNLALNSVPQTKKQTLLTQTTNQQEHQSTNEAAPAPSPINDGQGEGLKNEAAPAPIPINYGQDEGLKSSNKAAPAPRPIEEGLGKGLKKPKSNNLLLAANMRFGGQVAGGAKNMQYSENAAMPSDTENSYSDKNTSAGLSNSEADRSLADLLADYPKISYLPPISAGFMVRKYLTNRIALETGLFYTYLQTDFLKENEWMQEKARLKMHYIGIPLNVIIDIVKKPKWNLYGSVGCAVEKGLWLTYHKKTTYTYNTDFSYDENLGEKIKYIQMSVIAALGIDVTIVKNFSIYFEPRVGYYFRNMQPVSIRTASPLNIELNAGLRMKFN